MNVKRYLVLAGIPLLVLWLVYRQFPTWLGLKPPEPPWPQFDAALVAKQETAMWRSYYDADPKQLREIMVMLQRKEFGLNYLQGLPIADHLARAAEKFATTRGDYERQVLPDLVESYRALQFATKRGFDPERAARAELAWWVARRDARRNSPEQVGHLIAALYGELFGGARPELEQAGYLRAKAAALRDRGGANADWITIEKLLAQSYALLLQSSGAPRISAAPARRA
jgi:hypothetical protein